MKRKFLLMLVIPLFFYSCNKEKAPGDQLTSESVNDYLPLTIGNYWVYKNYICDSGEVNCDNKGIDTSYVSKDTLINGHTYFKIEGGSLWFYPKYFRDSGEFIVNEKGEIVFTHVNTESTFNHHVINGTEDSVFYWYYQLQSDPEIVLVEAGEFTCLNFRGSFFRKKDNYDVEFNMRGNYAKNVGLVEQSTFFASSVQVIKRELIDYHILPDQGVVP